MTMMEKAHMEKGTALLVVDVQVGMFEGPEGLVHGGEILLEKIGDLLRRARESRVPVIYIQHCEGPGEILEKGTDWWQIHPSIAPLAGELVIEKRTPDSFHETTLREELDSRGITRLILAGIQTEYCIDTTCRRTFSLSYDVVLVKDAHGTWDTDHISASQIIAHHNEVLGNWFSEAVEADAVDLAVSAGTNG